jgi:predicted membrane protein
VKRCLEMYLLALGVCGLSLGYVAWPGTAWGGALSILLPFMCGLQPTRLRALAISAGYYLGALSPYAISELLVTQGIDGWERLVTTSLVLAFSSAVWSLNGGHHPTAFRPFITLLGVWFVTLITPMGGWGLAHPGLGWLFIGKGGMGALTFVVAGVLTSLLVTAIRREREQQAPVSVISGRSLAFAICTTVILGGTFDQTAAPSHAGPVAAMPTNRSQVELQRSDIQRNQAMRLDALLGKLALVNLQYEPILLVFTPQWASPSFPDGLLSPLSLAQSRLG